MRLIGTRYGETPVAVITAFGSADNAVAALKAGAFDYLAKPVALDQLRTLIKSVITSYSIHYTKLYDTGFIQFDPVWRQFHTGYPAKTKEQPVKNISRTQSLPLFGHTYWITTP